MYSVLKVTKRAEVTLLIKKNFHVHQLNSRRYPAFPGAISTSRRFPGFTGVADAPVYCVLFREDNNSLVCNLSTNCTCNEPAV